MDKLKIAVVMGGYSDEDVVSIASGELIYAEIDRTKYDPYRVMILKNEWYMLDHNNKKIPVSRNDFTAQFGQNTLKFDVCFNTILGSPGENGEIQTLWDSIGMKYTGCNAQLSALTFNKKATLQYLSKFGVPSAKRLSFRKGEHIDLEKIISDLGLPVIVKPNQSGSSLGVSKVDKKQEFEKAFDFAFGESDEILIETFLKGTEVTVGINRYEGKAKVFGITEIVSFNAFNDKAAKYEGQAQLILPARISEDDKRKVEQISILAYNALGMTTTSRSEFIIMNGTPYMLEMNTNPGFSPKSILPTQIRYSQMSIQHFCTVQIEKAMSRKDFIHESEQIFKKEQFQKVKEIKC